MSAMQLEAVSHPRALGSRRSKVDKSFKKVPVHECERIWLPFLQGSMLANKICEHFCFPKKKQLTDLPIPTHDGPFLSPQMQPKHSPAKEKPKGILSLDISGPSEAKKEKEKEDEIKIILEPKAEHPPTQEELFLKSYESFALELGVPDEIRADVVKNFEFFSEIYEAIISLGGYEKISILDLWSRISKKITQKRPHNSSLSVAPDKKESAYMFLTERYLLHFIVYKAGFPLKRIGKPRDCFLKPVIIKDFPMDLSEKSAWFKENVSIDEFLVLQNYAWRLGMSCTAFSLHSIIEKCGSEPVVVLEQSSVVSPKMTERKPEPNQREQMTLKEYIERFMKSRSIRDDECSLSVKVIDTRRLESVEWLRLIECLEKINIQYLVPSNKESLLGLMRGEIIGVTEPLVYFRPDDSWIGCQQEGMVRLDINHGPGKVEWFVIPPSHSRKFRKFCKEFLGKDILNKNDKFLGSVIHCLAARVPMQFYLQRPGDIVVIPANSIKWSKTVGATVSSTWAICPTSVSSFVEVLKFNEAVEESKNKSSIPVRTMALDVVNLAESFLDKQFTEKPDFNRIMEKLDEYVNSAEEVWATLNEKGLKANPEQMGKDNVLICSKCGEETMVFWGICEECHSIKGKGTKGVFCASCLMNHPENCETVKKLKSKKEPMEEEFPQKKPKKEEMIIESLGKSQERTGGKEEEERLEQIVKNESQDTSTKELFSDEKEEEEKQIKTRKRAPWNENQIERIQKKEEDSRMKIERVGGDEIPKKEHRSSEDSKEDYSIANFSPIETDKTQDISQEKSTIWFGNSQNQVITSKNPTLRVFQKYSLQDLHNLVSSRRAGDNRIVRELASPWHYISEEYRDLFLDETKKSDIIPEGGIRYWGPETVWWRTKKGRKEKKSEMGEEKISRKVVKKPQFWKRATQEDTKKFILDYPMRIQTPEHQKIKERTLKEIMALEWNDDEKMMSQCQALAKKILDEEFPNNSLHHRSIDYSAEFEIRIAVVVYLLLALFDTFFISYTLETAHYERVCVLNGKITKYKKCIMNGEKFNFNDLRKDSNYDRPRGSYNGGDRRDSRDGRDGRPPSPYRFDGFKGTSRSNESSRGYWGGSSNEQSRNNYSGETSNSGYDRGHRDYSRGNERDSK